MWFYYYQPSNPSTTKADQIAHQKLAKRVWVKNKVVTTATKDPAVTQVRQRQLIYPLPFPGDFVTVWHPLYGQVQEDGLLQGLHLQQEQADLQEQAGRNQTIISSK